MNAPPIDVLRSACGALTARDPTLAEAYRAIGLPNWRRAEATYPSLARIVVFQLISTRAAEAIWTRIVERYGTVTARAVLDDDPEQLRACGLSRPKTAHLRAIAQAVGDATINFQALAEAPIDAARARLLSVPGIGPWTADTFLMTAYGHLDAFPSGDVGLIEAHRRLSGAGTRLRAKAFAALAESWRPYRAVAAHLLYDWYNAQRA